MRITQAVFGVFHHFELAHQLHRRGHLQRIYSTWPWARLKREGLPHAFVRTFPPFHTAEYLLGRSTPTPPALLAKLAQWNALAFDRYTLFQLPRAPGGFPHAFIAISGAGLLTGTEVQRRGGIFICDRGSTHQRFQDEIVRAEYARWNLPIPRPKPHILAREEAIYAQADAITVPSTVAKRSFVQMGVPPEKVHVIPYGVRLDKFAPTPNSVPSSFDSFTLGQDPALHASQPHRDAWVGATSTLPVTPSATKDPDEPELLTTSRTHHPPSPSPPHGHFISTESKRSGKTPVFPSSPPQTFHLLFAGSVSLRKGVPYLLQAFAALRHPDKQLTIIGHIADDIRPLLRRLPTQNVTFTGALPQPELARLMARSHALVLPSIEEGLALVQAQAMACGCPVIATAATGADDLFTDGIEGFILSEAPGTDPTQALTARMQQLADDRALRQSMRHAALARVHRLGGWDQYGDLWESLLTNLCQAPRRP